VVVVAVPAQRRRERGPRPRNGLAAVPDPVPPLVRPVGPVAADEVAADAEAELTELAGVLHDGPVQSLLAATWALELADRAAAPAAPDGGLGEVRHALGHALADLRRVMGDLRPRGVQGGLAGVLAALGERTPGLRLDDRAVGAVTAECSGAVYRLVTALAADPDPVPGDGQPAAGTPRRAPAAPGPVGAAAAVALTVATRDRRGVVLLEVRLRGPHARDRAGRGSVQRSLRRLDALGARVAVATASGAADLLLALPAESCHGPALPAAVPSAPDRTTLTALEARL